MIGKTLGHYQITRQLGKGGMGEVYQAKDEKLGRDVAIKVLPEEFAKDTNRVARFQREATLLASLNHPNIAAIYGLEESDGTKFLVLELVEGKTLADRIKAGPIPVEESLKLALQIAEALEAAHEKGVVHRDLKPANVMVTPAHKIKILDFGLAKQSRPAADSDQPTQTLTAVAGETMPGTILGTAGYMSPEQARGKAGDERSDIWAFGCILFEMLSGQKTFVGDTASDKIASILAREPDWDALPREIPQSVKHLLQQCLEKDLDRRFPKISDARAAVGPVLITSQVGEGFTNRFRFGRKALFVIVTIFLLLAAATAWIDLTRRSNAPSAIPDRKFLVVPPFQGSEWSGLRAINRRRDGCHAKRPPGPACGHSSCDAVGGHSGVGERCRSFPARPEFRRQSAHARHSAEEWRQRANHFLGLERTAASTDRG